MSFDSAYRTFLRPVLLASMGMVSSAAYAHSTLQALAQEKIAQALADVLNEAQRATLQIEITVKSPRGAALRPCPSAWQWDPIDLGHWQRVHMGMRCEGVAGSLVAQVKASAPVWTTAHALPKGHRLQAQDLQQHIRTIDSAQDMVEPSALLHMQLRKPLRAGVTVQTHDVERAAYARKGQTVEIRASVDGITVSTTGLAPRTAYQGDTLRVRNLHSQQWVTGRLIAPGILEASDQPSGGVKVQLESID